MQATLPQTAEYGTTLAKENLSTRTTLQTKQAVICGKVREVELAHVSPGYVPAGSAMRLQASECWSIRWHDGSAYQGRSFRTESEANEHFATYTAQ